MNRARFGRGMFVKSALAVSAAAVMLAAGAFYVGARSANAQDAATDAGAALNGETLMKGLMQIPGCLGVETADTMSGKSVIFAWFENKAAAVAWFKSETHQNAMNAGFPGYESAGAPLEGIPENVPIMVIASLTPGEHPEGAPGVLPMSQIAIEMYTPLKGGIHYGGTFAPAGLKIKAIRDLQKP